MAARSLEIACEACGEETFVRCEPVYEGFTKTGESYICTSCGHVYESEADVPFKVSTGPSVFTDADRPEKIEVFRDEERGKVCRRCRHYVINPFTQRCGLHDKRVEATDYCDQFERPPKPSTDAPSDDGSVSADA